MAPDNKIAAENNKPPGKPPAWSDTHPVKLGPNTCPTANTLVNTVMTDTHCVGGRLCLMKAVVDATAVAKHPPNNMPEANMAATSQPWKSLPLSAMQAGMTQASASRLLTIARH